MAVDGKWIDGLHSDMSLAEAARTALKARFDAVVDRWKNANDKPGDPETIHQLRVASRRASAALDTLGERLPRGQARQLRRQLRKVRREAGNVRDRDVFLHQLAKWSKGRDSAEHPGLDYLCGIWTHKRNRCCHDMRRRLTRYDRFADLASVLTLRGGNKATLGQRASDVVPQMLSRFADSIRKPDQDLHPIRIAGKQLRYGLELFSSCIAPGHMAGPYALIEELQDILGEAHDAEVNAGRVKRELKEHSENGSDAPSRYRLGIENWLIQLQALETAGLVHFIEWLPRWHAADTELDLLSMGSSQGPSNSTAKNLS